LLFALVGQCNPAGQVDVAAARSWRHGTCLPVTFDIPESTLARIPRAGALGVLQTIASHTAELGCFVLYIRLRELESIIRIAKKYLQVWHEGIQRRSIVSGS
jgi:hypothetical protein